MTDLQTLLRDIFGFDQFRAGQQDIVEAVCVGKNVLAIMPTGGGKSLCYQLPALVRDGLTVVISPLIALMRDQVCGPWGKWRGGRGAYLGQYARGNRCGFCAIKRSEFAVALSGARTACIQCDALGSIAVQRAIDCGG